MKRNLLFTEDEQKEMELESRKKCASFFFTLAQLVFTAFIVGSLVIFFSDFNFTWRILCMFIFGVIFMVTLFKAALVFYNLNIKEEEETE